MGSYWRIVNDVIKNSDIILIIGDAREPERSINQEVVDKVERYGKKVIKVLNKCDLISRDEYRKILNKYHGYITVSARKHLNTMNLLRRINGFAKGEPVIVGVVGYPNTGKSAVINALKGRASAPTSPIAGYTKGPRIVRVTSKIQLIDTPGVIPYMQKDEFFEVMISAKSPEQVEDPEVTVMQLIKEQNGKIEAYYKVPVSDDFEETLDTIALKMNLLMKGGVPDPTTASKRIIRDFQLGKMR
jgi:hypothetical protein